MEAEQLSRITGLLKKHLQGELTTEEHAALQQWVALSDENCSLFNTINDADQLEQALQLFFTARKNILQKVQDAVPELNVVPLYPAPLVTAAPRKSKRWFTLLAAAVVITVLGGIGLYLTLYPKKTVTGDVKQAAGAADIAPGTDKAVLTLGDGTKILLDNTGNGTVAVQGSSKVEKMVNGQLVYKPGTNNTSEVLYNTLSTPRGGQQQLTLPDGSKVWLNAASSIRFPVTFTGNERQVAITGECYLEVVHNTAKPFKVMLNREGINKTIVEVLGTSFNVNAYENEPMIQATLVKGSVKIIKNEETALLKPGQSANINKQGALKVNENANLEEIIAWKNGDFHFDETDMRAIMRQVSRWYNVDVVFQDEISGGYFATIKRDAPVSGLLKILELSGGVHFEIQGNRIIVMKSK